MLSSQLVSTLHLQAVFLHRLLHHGGLQLPYCYDSTARRWNFGDNIFCWFYQGALQFAYCYDSTRWILSSRRWLRIELRIWLPGRWKIRPFVRQQTVSPIPIRPHPRLFSWPHCLLRRIRFRNSGLTCIHLWRSSCLSLKKFTDIATCGNRGALESIHF